MKKANLEKLREIPILTVAGSLGLNTVKTGPGTWGVRKEASSKEVTSLVLFEKNNRWKRFSGIEQGGVSQGSVLDLVMHVQEIDFGMAVEWLSSSFPEYA